MFDEKQIEVMIDRETLETRIAELGAKISEDYAGKELYMICVLKGGAMFMTELSKSITIPVLWDFMVLSSYGNDLISSGEVSIKKNLDGNIEGKHILIVEDIVDTGRTLCFLSEYLMKKGAASVKIATMLDKPARRVVPVSVDYTGFSIEDEFVVGYGLDYAQRYRNLPYIGYVKM